MVPAVRFQDIHVEMSSERGKYEGNAPLAHAYSKSSQRRRRGAILGEIDRCDSWRDEISQMSFARCAFLDDRHGTFRQRLAGNRAAFELVRTADDIQLTYVIAEVCRGLMSELSAGCLTARLSTALRMRSKANEGGAMNSVLFVP